MIIIENPKGEIKNMTDNELFDFKVKIAQTNTFKYWAENNYISAYFKHYGSEMLNVAVIEKFLSLKGYKIEHCVD